MIAHAAYASATSADNERSVGSIDLTSNPFVVGTNVVAVMIKQVSATSSDLSFDLELSVRYGQPNGGTGGTSGSGGTTGTGGTAGVAYLEKIAGNVFFPELWDVRTVIDEVKPRSPVS